MYMHLDVNENNIVQNDNFSFNQWKAELTKELPTFWKLIDEKNKKKM